MSMRCVGLAKINESVRARLEKYDLDKDGVVCENESTDIDIFDEQIPKTAILEREVPFRRFSIGFELGGALNIFNAYAGMSDADRQVPPHPDDVAKGAATSPISIKEKNQFLFYPLGLNLGFSLLPWLRLKNTFSAAIQRYKFGDYQYPPENRQRYSSGDNAYTFMDIGNIFSDSLVIEPKLEWSFLKNVDFWLGGSVTAIERFYGWDRYGSTELLSSKYKLYPGVVIGLGIRDPGTAEHNFEVGGLRATLNIAYTGGEPMISIGAALIYMDWLFH